MQWRLATEAELPFRWTMDDYLRMVELRQKGIPMRMLIMERPHLKSAEAVDAAIKRLKYRGLVPPSAMRTRPPNEISDADFDRLRPTMTNRQLAQALGVGMTKLEHYITERRARDEAAIRAVTPLSEEVRKRIQEGRPRAWIVNHLAREFGAEAVYQQYCSVRYGGMQSG